MKKIVEGVLESNLDNQSDLSILTEASTKILPSLFKLVETLNSKKDNIGTGSSAKEGTSDMDTDGEDKKKRKKEESQRAQLIAILTETIGAYASICPPHFLQTLFKKIMQRLLVSTQSEEDESEKICTLLGLAQALVKSGALDDASISLLYRAVRPLIRTDENSTSVQKRSYKVMAEICQRHKQFILDPERLGEMTELMVGSVFTCQTASRHMRLKCMSLMLEGFKSENREQMEVIPKIMGEVLLCLKDSNTKTREAAYGILVSMAQVHSNITEYFQTILAALGAQTPHMRSAAVQALSRLVFEFSRNDPVVQSFLPSLLETVCVLFDESAREVIKSVIGFVRVCVAAMSHDQLEPLLPGVVGGIMKYNKGKGRFRSKIKIIMKKLVRKYGYTKITPLVPENDIRLLTHMRKLAEKAERRKATGGFQEGKEESGEINGFDEMMDSDEDDSDDGRTLMTGMTGGTRMTTMSRKSVRSSALTKSGTAKSVTSMAKSTRSGKINQPVAPKINIKDEKAGNVFDMLDSKMTKNLKYADDDEENDEFSDDDGAMEFDDRGRLVVHDDLEEDDDKPEKAEEEDDTQENDEIHGGGKKQRISKFESAKVARDEANKNTRNKNKNDQQALGAAYKSKKAGGDVMKKGQKYEPFAYVPLDGKRYSKKHRNNAVAQMATVVRNQNTKRKRR
uniref:TOG domain-containing protein n=1 Tax=Eucampia antarctica TaxID=49252 RepID=A0A7S2SK72_9STRA